MTDPQWKGLFEWSMKYSDGTRVSDFSDVEVDPAKIEWLQEVLTNYIKDLTERLKEIKTALEDPEKQHCSLQEQEALLTELQEIVEDIDQAKNLHLIGGMPLVIDLLESPHNSIRWRAADIVAASVQNHYEAQQSFFEGGALPRVLSITQSDDADCQLKGWMAVSCLVRNYPPALQAFEQLDGLRLLTLTVDSEDVRLKRRGLFLMEYILSQSPIGHFSQLNDQGYLTKIIQLITHEDMDVREKTLSVLLVVITIPDGKTLLQNDPIFRQKIEDAESAVKQLEDEEKESRLTEIEQLQRLRKEIN